MEIITGVERRRHWRTEDKLRIVAEAERPGARFGDVARRHEVSRGLLWQWRDQARRGVLVAEPAPVFVPVQVTADPPAPRLEPPAGPSAAAGDAGRRLRAAYADVLSVGGVAAARLRATRA